MKEVQISLIVLGFTGFIFAVLLSFLSRRLKVQEDPRIEKVLEVLPGLNCGACGFSGCRAYAEAVVKKSSLFSGCLPGGGEINQKVSQVVGIIGCVGADSQIAICHCQAGEQEKKSSARYLGPCTCQAADITGGSIDCFYGCIGLDDCVKVCPVGAIEIQKGKVCIDTKKCTGCGNCIRSCPRNLFALVSLKEVSRLYYVGCSNHDKVVETKKVCSRGCIGCGICVRLDNSPYYLKDNLSRIDRQKALAVEPQEEGLKKCPTHCIWSIDV